jgi:methionyl-tRNA formyltransferase
MKALRIVYMGTPDFAVPSLLALHASQHQVVGVVTVADKPSGRGLQLQESPVKKCAQALNIPILQPIKLKSEEFLAELRALQADLFVVVAFRMLPEVVWNMPVFGTINLHGSLLPKYRGAAPINWAIVNGEKETGVTVFQLQHEIDTGQVFQRATLLIGPDENASSVHDRMMTMGAEVLKKTVDDIASGQLVATDQSLLLDGQSLPHAPKIFKEDCAIDWQLEAGNIHNKVRGLSYYPAAYTMLEDKQCKIFAGKPELTGKYETGFESDMKSYLKFGCRDGWYHITDLQLEGKKRLGIVEFLRGHRFKNQS